MKTPSRRVLFVLIIGGMLMLLACGGGGVVTTTSTNNGTPAPTATPVIDPACPAPTYEWFLGDCVRVDNKLIHKGTIADHVDKKANEAAPTVNKLTQP